MKLIIYCPLCKAYHYVILLITYSVYRDNKTIRYDKFTCCNCGKTQTKRTS